MEKLVIEGGARISGAISPHGAKNAALPILSAALLGRKTTLKNCPRLLDVSAAADILAALGCTVRREGEALFINAEHAAYADPPERLMREMRSSILFLGAMLARFGRARVSFPGGCELGARPVDMHLDGLRRLGALIEEDHGFLNCSAKRLRGADITLPFPSVGATENIMIAAAAATGESVIRNAAREPEIQDLADFLNACGANIVVSGDEIAIAGQGGFSDCVHSVIPDRIEAVTYLCAAAATGGSITLSGIRPQHIAALIPVFEEMGCLFTAGQAGLFMSAPDELSAVDMIKTMPYPGFPTDAQAPVMAALCRARGTSVIVENIFEARYKHIGVLRRMGAQIETSGRVAVVRGVPGLHSAAVCCTDLRGGAALVVAALCADGKSTITELRHIDRGYSDIVSDLKRLGADIKREE